MFTSIKPNGNPVLSHIFIATDVSICDSMPLYDSWVIRCHFEVFEEMCTKEDSQNNVGYKTKPFLCLTIQPTNHPTNRPQYYITAYNTILPHP